MSYFQSFGLFALSFFSVLANTATCFFHINVLLFVCSVRFPTTR